MMRSKNLQAIFALGIYVPQAAYISGSVHGSQLPLITVAPVGAPVPESKIIALLSLALVGFAGAEVRRKRKKTAIDKS